MRITIQTWGLVAFVPEVTFGPETRGALMFSDIDCG
jgi:hypothetical protein